MPTYDFKCLSSRDFEELVRDLLQPELKVTIETFKSGKDKGIDLRYASPIGETCIIQCKHFAESGFKGLIRELKEAELNKVQALSPSKYILCTSVPLSPQNKDEIVSIFDPFIKSTSDVLGQNDLNNLLGKYPKIEADHYKLWLSSTPVLTRVLKNAASVKTTFHVNKIIEKLPLYVHTKSFNAASKILSEQQFIIISGIPGIGKTTLAEMLIYLYLSKDFALIPITENIKEAFDLFDPTQQQIFYYDDFLGRTILQSHLGKNEDAEIIDFINIVRKHPSSRFILTTREYILQQANIQYERISQGNLDIAKYVLSLPSFTRMEKARILYNHLYFSKLPTDFINEVLKDNFYINIIEHKNYNPRIVEWMTNPVFIAKTPYAGYRNQFTYTLNNPANLWESAFSNQIEHHSRILLLSLCSFKPPVIMNVLQNVFNSVREVYSEKYKVPTHPNDFRFSLKELEGTFTLTNQNSVDFNNPSIVDFLETKIMNDPEYIEIILHSIRYFEQIINIVRIAHEKHSKLNKQSLLESITNNLRNPVIKIELIGTNHTYVQQDSRIFERTLFLAKIFEENNDQEYLDLMKKSIELSIQASVDSHPCYDIFGIDNQGLKNLIQFVVGMKKIDDSIKNEMLKLMEPILSQALTQAHSVIDMEELAQVIRSHSYLYSKYQNILKQEFERYLSEDFSDECNDLNNSDMAAQVIDCLTTIGEKVETDIKSQINEVEAIRSQLDDEERAEADKHSDEAYEMWHEREQDAKMENEEIESMFQSLRDVEL